VVGARGGVAALSRLPDALVAPATHDPAANLMAVQALNLLTQMLGDRWSERALQAEVQLEQSRAVAGEKEREIQALLAQMAEKEQSIQVLSAQVAEKEQVVHSLSAQVNCLTRDLDAIYTSKWWKLAGRYWTVQGRLRGAIRRILPLNARRWLRSRLSLLQVRTITSGPATEIDIPQANKLDIICFPVIDWNFRFQRPQQLLTQFAQRGHRVFYIRPNFIGLARQAAEVTYLSKNIYELALPGGKDTILYQDHLTGPTLDRAYAALQEFICQHDVAEAVCLIQFPFWEPLVQALRARYSWKLVYDCMDDHSGFATNDPAVVGREAELVASSDLVVATSQLLYQRLSQANPNCILVPNGGDYAHFSSLPPRDASPLSAKPRPIIGYYGAIAEWFDTEAVCQAAALHPEWSFVLIGHTFGSNLKGLDRQPNVELLGEKPYAELPLYLAGFDICIIPFLRTPLTEATNPVKVFEYLSAGKPVVAAALRELDPLDEVIYQYRSSEEFVDLLEQALEEDSPSLLARRQEVARDNTWEKRYQALESQIKALYGKASIIIVTWNNLNFTRQCIKSVLDDQTWPNVELIVVDNASRDGTTQYLQSLAEKEPRVKVIFNDQNRGFAAANNIGLQYANDSEFVVLLNNDVVVPRGWLPRLLRHARRPDIGSVGPLTNWAGNEAKIEVSYSNIRDMEAFARAYICEHSGKVFDIPSLAMYCVAMRKAVVDQVGRLDERFGIGMFEDDDYARRVRQAGYRVICAEDVFVHHYGMASFAKLGDAEYKKLFERNKQLYEEKWGEPWMPHQYRNQPTE
jgi:GT2 family glycosyltransferase/glycosyltransferase involved in cell wall biosynthesis/uncharacterized coiled-coil protein SlyX